MINETCYDCGSPMSATSAPGPTVLVTRLSRLVYRRCTEAALGMRLKHFITLAQLRDRNGLSQQALGEALCIDANNLVLLLNELEEAGLAARRRDPEDRRRHIVEITAAGLEALELAEAAIESVEDEVLTGLDRDSRAKLCELLMCALEGEAPPAAEAQPAELARSDDDRGARPGIGSRPPAATGNDDRGARPGIGSRPPAATL
jgi:DNA-binding MarR family transcriptional regulator